MADYLAGIFVITIYAISYVILSIVVTMISFLILNIFIGLYDTLFGNKKN